MKSCRSSRNCFCGSALFFLAFLLSGCYTKLEHSLVLQEGHFMSPLQDSSCLQCHQQNLDHADPNFSWWMSFGADRIPPSPGMSTPWWRSASIIMIRGELGEAPAEADVRDPSLPPPVYDGHDSGRRLYDEGSETAGSAPKPADVIVEDDVKKEPKKEPKREPKRKKKSSAKKQKDKTKQEPSAPKE
jgi:hypothetical protein